MPSQEQTQTAFAAMQRTSLQSRWLTSTRWGWDSPDRKQRSATRTANFVPLGLRSGQSGCLNQVWWTNISPGPVKGALQSRSTKELAHVGIPEGIHPTLEQTASIKIYLDLQWNNLLLTLRSVKPCNRMDCTENKRSLKSRGPLWLLMNFVIHLKTMVPRH